MNLQDRQSFTLGITYIIFRRYVMMFVTFLVVLAFFLFAGYLLTPTWEAEVLLLAEQQAPPVVSPFGGSPVPASRAEAAENLALMLGGKGIAYDMVKAFGLDERTRIRAQEPPTFRDWCKKAIVETMMSPITLLEYLGLKEAGEVDWVDKAAEDFREGITSVLDVESMEDSQVVSLKINGETPQLAMDIANAMVKRARERLAEANARASQDTQEAHRRELQRVSDQLAEAEARLKAFQESQGGVTLTEETRAKTAKLHELTAEDSRLRNEIDVLGRQLGEAALNPAISVSINSAAIANNNVVQSLRSALHAKEVQLAVFVTERTPEHPDVLNLNEEIAGLREALGTEIANVHKGLITDQSRIQAEIAELQVELLTLPGKELALAELTLSAETYRSLYRDLLRASEEMEVIAHSGIAALDFKVLDDAYVSPLQTSDFPDWLVVLAIAGAVGIATAFALALFVEYWRDPVKEPGDLRQEGIEVLGVVPRVS